MALDPNIILGVRPMQDPMESMGRAMSLAQLVQQGRVQRMQLEQAEREVSDQRTLADLYRGAIGADGKLDRGALLQGAASRGLGARIPGLQKAFGEADKAEAELGKTRAETQKLDLGMLQERVRATNGVLASLMARPQVTRDDVLAAMNGLAQQGLARPEDVQTAAQQIPVEPAALRPWLQQKALEGVEAGKRLELLTPKLDWKNTGKQMVPVDTNAWTNPNPQPLQMTTTPDADLSATTARRGQDISAASAAASRSQAERHFQATQAQGGTVVEKDAAGNFVLVDKRTGTARPVSGTDGRPVGTGAAVKDATEALQLINQALPLLQQSTGSYGGKAMDMLSQVFGSATPGSIAAGQLKAIEGALISKMPKMSGPQSDKDVLLYRQMAAEVGDDTVPPARKRAALETLRQIQERYAGVAPGSSRLQAGAAQGQGGASGGWSGGAPAQQPQQPAAPQVPSWRDAGYGSQAAAVQDALNAIQRGAPKAAVIQRLEAAGIKNHGIK